VSELGDEIRNVLARADRSLRRFGAAQHRYELLPTAELSLPDQLATFAREVGAGGAGPGYGLVPLGQITPTRGLWPVAHLGCGYVAAVHERGDVVIVTPSVTGKLADGFLAWYAGWLERLGSGAPTLPEVAPGTCALAGALSAYLGMAEDRAGHPLDDAELRDALEALPPGAIAIAAEEGNLLFPPGARRSLRRVCGDRREPDPEGPRPASRRARCQTDGVAVAARMIVFGNRRLGPGSELLLSPEVAREMLEATAAVARASASARWERELCDWLAERALHDPNIDVDDLAWTPEHFERQRRFLVEAIELAAAASVHASALRRWGVLVASHPRASVQVGRRWQWSRSTINARNN
jgi:hypothetical protein